MVLLITDTGDHQRLQIVAERIWDRILLRILGATLDRQLAAGCPPETNRLLALRAQELASWRFRSALAWHWQNLLAVVERGTARVPLCRIRIADAVPDVREMCDALILWRPTPARGVAMASMLLRDGTGPLYNPESTVDIHEALRETIAELDPTTRLVTL
jgi:hypothetical protein